MLNTNDTTGPRNGNETPLLPPPPVATVAVVPKSKTKRTKTNWDEHPADLQAYVDAMRRKEPVVIGDEINVHIPRGTVWSWMKQIDDHYKKNRG